MKHGENYEQSKALISLFLSLTSSSFFLTSIDSIWCDSGWSTCSCFESNRVCRRRQAFQEHKRGCLLRFSVCLPPSSFEPLEFYSSHVRICEFHSFRLWLFLIPHDDDMAFAFAPKWFDFARKEGFFKMCRKNAMPITTLSFSHSGTHARTHAPTLLLILLLLLNLILRSTVYTVGPTEQDRILYGKSTFACTAKKELF